MVRKIQDYRTCAPLLAPSTAMAQAESPGVCDDYDGDHQMIQLGAQGEPVYHAQCLLKSLGYDLVEDGLFSRETAMAVASFQSDLRLEQANGVVEAGTWAALHGEAIPRSSAATSRD